MQVTVVAEREVAPGSQESVKGLLRELRYRASRQPGFMSGMTAIDPRKPARFLTVCVWSSLGNWERWRGIQTGWEVTRQIEGLLNGKAAVEVWAMHEDAPVAAV